MGYIDNKFKINLRALRVKRGLSATKLSTETGVSRSTISEIESGKYLASSLTLYKISKVLNCTMEDLIIIEQ